MMYAIQDGGKLVKLEAASMEAAVKVHDPHAHSAASMPLPQGHYFLVTVKHPSGKGYLTRALKVREINDSD